MLSFIFFARCHASPDMALGFVQIQYLSCFTGKLGIDLPQTLGNIFMFRCH